jgi:hypothetical protein
MKYNFSTNFFCALSKEMAPSRSPSDHGSKRSKSNKGRGSSGKSNRSKGASRGTSRGTSRGAGRGRGRGRGRGMMSSPERSNKRDTPRMSEMSEMSEMSGMSGMPGMPQTTSNKQTSSVPVYKIPDSRSDLYSGELPTNNNYDPPSDAPYPIKGISRSTSRSSSSGSGSNGSSRSSGAYSYKGLKKIADGMGLNPGLPSYSKQSGKTRFEPPSDSEYEVPSVNGSINKLGSLMKL